MILVGDLNASREGKRIGSLDGSNTMKYDKQLAEFIVRRSAGNDGKRPRRSLTNYLITLLMAHIVPSWIMFGF